MNEFLEIADLVCQDLDNLADQVWQDLPDLPDLPEYLQNHDEVSS